MRRAFAFLLITLSVAALPFAGLAYSSNICKGPTCDVSEVGRFMEGITRECGNLGNCSINDILMVFANAGNFAVGIVGALVLLMYVIGGMYMLSSAGSSDRVAKGKKYLTISTTGLLIVVFAYIGIKTLESVLRTAGGEGDFVEACTESTIGQPCGPSKQCFQADGASSVSCISNCEAFTPGASCKNASNPACISGLCPGEAVCCPPTP
ncbi:hypothetical protein HZA85_01625 [Candidatus Uhrbacteria bacterium]|nr:hypothetical protein [Candidatus Uhrbacteria bacterium]